MGDYIRIGKIEATRAYYDEPWYISFPAGNVHFYGSRDEVTHFMMYLDKYEGVKE